MCVASVLLFLSVGLALPHLAESGDMAVPMVWFFIVQPLSVVILCIAICVVSAQRARTLGLAWGWGIAIPVLVAMDWQWALLAPMMLVDPAAFPYPPLFPWAASSALVMIVAATLLPSRAFSVEASGARLATYALFLSLLVALVAGYAGDYHWMGTTLSPIACAGLAASAIVMWIATMGEPNTI